MWLGNNGQGSVDYFPNDSWLWGKVNYNFIMLDYADTIVAYGCQTYWDIYHYEYFWILNTKPILEYDRQMWFINYIKTKLPSYANKMPLFFQGEKCFADQKAIVQAAWSEAGLTAGGTTETTTTIKATSGEQEFTVATETPTSTDTSSIDTSTTDTPADTSSDTTTDTTGNDGSKLAEL